MWGVVAASSLLEQDVAGVDVDGGHAGGGEVRHRLEHLPPVQRDQLGWEWHRRGAAVVHVLGVVGLARVGHPVECVAE